jgi:IS5 family transposase
VDALGNPLSFHLTPGQACDLEGADKLLPSVVADTVLADKGYDADERVIELLQAQGKLAVIPSRRNRKCPRDYDKELYKARHLIETHIPHPQLSHRGHWLVAVNNSRNG